MNLADGMSYVNATLSEERLQLSNVAQRVLREEGISCYMRYDNVNNQYFTIDGDKGEIARITIHLSEDLLAGDYTITLSNIVMSNTYSSSGIQSSDRIECLLTIVDPRITLDEDSETAPTASDGPVNVQLKRTIKADQWSTICLPFSTTGEQVKRAFGEDVQLAGFTAWSLEEDEEGARVGIDVTFESLNADEGIEANTPLLIRVTQDVTTSLFEGVTVMPEDRPEVRVGTTSKTRGFFYGTYTPMLVPEENLFLNSNRFYYSTGKTTIRGYRSYFKFRDVIDAYYDGTEVKVNIYTDDEATPVEDILDKQADNNIYDLSGRKVTKPQQSGVYIVNGKKAIVK